MLHSAADGVDNVHDGGPQFAEVFVIYWLGAAVVTFNIKLLGGSMYDAALFIYSSLSYFIVTYWWM